MLAYMAVRGAGPGPLFRFQDGRALTRQRLVANLRTALRDIGLCPENYAGHSFRIGAATAAAACGIQDSLTKTMGRWESVAYQTHVRTLREQLVGVASRLAAANQDISVNGQCGVNN